MKKWLIVLVIGAGLVMCNSEPQSQLGQFDAHRDIGEVNRDGILTYYPDTQSYLIGGGGQNMWFDHDDFSLAYKKMAGDFILTARFEFLGRGINPHRKVGWMVRLSLQPDAVYADAIVHGDGLSSLQYRPVAGDSTLEVQADISGPEILQLERRGETFIMRAAKFGDPLRETGRVDVAMTDSLFVGLAICAHDDEAFEEAMVSNVRINIPAPADFQPYQDYSNSRLEIIEVESGKREVVYESDEPLEAPNWTRDGSALIYNSRGKLYRFDLETKTPDLIDTGFADQNNNDHVISWDGKQLGISHHVEGGSAIFTVPITGGTPERVTEQTPSYLHGWSPDDQKLVYTAERNGQFDLYQISVDGGVEQQLTNQPTLDDGSEYTPDGEWIYFNSARTGAMQIWRMRPDGGEPQQLTFDDWNDWFPHVSPDGESFIFLSYPPEIDAQDHPHYKHVMLRRLPRDGGEPQVFAYIYGGQGTINVPSWNPENTHVAFVSYTF